MPRVPTLLLLTACTAGPCSPATPAPTPGIELAVARALPAVVLVIPERGTFFGAGVIVDDQGHVLTNLHVVGDAGQPRVLLHDPERTAWSPLDGGLERLIFEAEDDLVQARVVRVDPILDLALLQVPAAVGQAGLPVRETPPRQGEPVLALGHPEQAVWSFTSGVVSAVRPGVVQHDAPINRGNSGGPLVDMEGRLLGINTSKVLGGAEGLGFARPADLAWTLLDPQHRPLTPDLSSPERAAVTCEGILELAPDQTADCVRWEDGRGMTLLAAERASDWLALGPGQREQVRQGILDVPAEDHADAWREAAVANWMGQVPARDPMRLGLPTLWPEPADKERHLAEHPVMERLDEEMAASKAFVELRAERLRTLNGLKEDIGADGLAYARMRKRGQRVEGAHYVRDDVVWLVGAGRNEDGSTWRSSSCWVDSGDGRWRRALGCEVLHRAPLPEGVPPDVITTEDSVRPGALRIARYLLEDAEPWGNQGETRGDRPM